MRTFSKSSKLDNVCYDIRGPVMDEANEMIANSSSISETLLRSHSMPLTR